MASLFPSVDQVRIGEIQGEVPGDDAEALARLFDDEGITGGGSATERLRAVLAATERGAIKGLHTGLAFRDNGFRGEPAPGGDGLRDPWPDSGSVNQVGHFLTAVRLGFEPSVVSESVGGLPLRRWIGADEGLSDEQVAMRLAIGHELAADPGLLRGGMVGGLAGALMCFGLTWNLGLEKHLVLGSTVLGLVLGALQGAATEHLLGFRRQYRRARAEDERAWREALSGVGEERVDLATLDERLGPILARIDVRSQGNSYQDLRLSLLGWRLGEQVRAGAIRDRHEVALWIRRHLSAGGT